MLAKELISCTVLSGYNIQKDIENARFHSAFFTYEESMINDGLIHLLANGDISFAYSCSYTFSFIPCYHFFYIYEGTLTVTSGSSKSSYSKNTAALFEAGSEITYATNGKCRFYEAFILGAPLRLYHEFLPESIYYKKGLCRSLCTLEPSFTDKQTPGGVVCHRYFQNFQMVQ